MCRTFYAVCVESPTWTEDLHMSRMRLRGLANAQSIGLVLQNVGSYSFPQQLPAICLRMPSNLLFFVFSAFRQGGSLLHAVTLAHARGSGGLACNTGRLHYLLNLRSVGRHHPPPNLSVQHPISPQLKFSQPLS